MQRAKSRKVSACVEGERDQEFEPLLNTAFEMTQCRTLEVNIKFHELRMVKLERESNFIINCKNNFIIVILLSSP